MDNLACEFVIKFMHDTYNSIVFEDFQKCLMVYTIKSLLKVNEIQVQGCLSLNDLFDGNS